MPKLSHLLLLALVAINIPTINAMDQKDFVIAISDNTDIKESLQTYGFDITKTTIIPTPIEAVSIKEHFENHLTNYINKTIQKEKKRNSNCKIYLYADYRTLYSLNYTANNSHIIDGLILDKTDYNPDQPFIERILDHKLSHLIEKIHSKVPVIIGMYPKKNNSHLCNFLYNLFATTRRKKTIKQFNHNTFLVSCNKIIPYILNNPTLYQQLEQQPILSDTDIATNAIRQLDNLAYRALSALKIFGGGSLLYILYKIGILAMLMR